MNDPLTVKLTAYEELCRIAWTKQSERLTEDHVLKNDDAMISGSQKGQDEVRGTSRRNLDNLRYSYSLGRTSD